MQFEAPKVYALADFQGKCTQLAYSELFPPRESSQPENAQRINMDPIIDTFTTEFRKNMLAECDFSGEEDLTPAVAAQFFAALKTSICAAACVGIKHFLESHDCDEPFVVRDDVKLNATEPVNKDFLTPYGRITLARNNYQAFWGGETYQPLDEKWGMVGEFATESVRESVMFHVAYMSPAEVVTCLGKSSLFQPSKTAVDNILRETGQRTEASYAELHNKMLEQKALPENVDVLVCSMDGANILTREPGTKKGRPAERPQNCKDGDHPESSYRNVMTGVFSLYEAGDAENAPARLDATYIARRPESKFTTFKADFEREFTWIDAQFDQTVQRVMLHDGGRNIWTYCEGNPLYKNCLSLLDFYHATEHLSLASEAIFGKKSTKAKDWYKKWRSKLKQQEDGVSGLIQSIKYYESSVCGKNRKSDLAKELTFFRRNAARMNYKSFLDAGFPIGSGPVEAACKTIVKQRMCKSGQRWSLEGAQHVLHLRAIVKSGRWDIYWQELERRRLQEAA